MPKCVQCFKMYHPDYCVVVDEQLNAMKCVFCYLDKNEITLEHEVTHKKTKVTRQEAQKKYEVYLKKISESPNISKHLVNPTENKIIIPGSE